jgi:hypothetical protein
VLSRVAGEALVGGQPAAGFGCERALERRDFTEPRAQLTLQRADPVVRSPQQAPRRGGRARIVGGNGVVHFFKLFYIKNGEPVISQVRLLHRSRFRCIFYF